MDDQRFDHLARALSLAAGRRGTLRGLAGLSLAGLLAAFAGDADEDVARAEIGGRGYHDRRLRRRRRARRRHNQDNDKHKHKNKQKQKQRRRNRRKRGEENDPEPCTPNCAGKTCGPDGCGGACGSGCPSTAPICTAQGQCAPASATCSDGIQNGAETDTDCGGSCPPCAEGQGCAVDADCQSPATCGGAGSPGICGQPCIPRTCQDAGATCGMIGDGCGSILNCGLCAPDEVCGGAPGSPNTCSECDPDPRCSRVQPRGEVLPCCGINP